MGPIPFRVIILPHAADLLRAVLTAADADGRGEAARAAALKIHDGLYWLADELGESRGPLGILGEKRFVEISPVTAVFAVHLDRRDVHVGQFGLVRRRL